ncbi:MAG: DUF3341 domain-containing protein [Pseudomonadota bacterium]|nr:MAG: DUF3341 domain-containing protein [Pseudomonadota bacterium]
MRSGLLAEYEDPEILVRAIRALRREGIVAMDAHMPYPVREVLEALELPPSRVPIYCFLGGLAGASYAYLLQWWTNGFDYALNVGGRPLGAAPAFIPPTFEGTVLLAAFGALLSFLGFSRLPRLWAPVDEVPQFSRVTSDRFFLAVDATDPRFDRIEAENILLASGALSVSAFGLLPRKEAER